MNSACLSVFLNYLFLWCTTFHSLSTIWEPRIIETIAFVLILLMFQWLLELLIKNLGQIHIT